MQPLPDPASMSRDELEALATGLGQPAFRGRQLFGWLHGRGSRAYAEMTNLPAALRERLAAEAPLQALKEVRRQQATDGTIKLLFALPSGRHIETVLIPDLAHDGRARRLTVCVSSQVGCAMGCHFCATGRMGFLENLSAGQIVEQVLRMEALGQAVWGRGVSNVVFMGMGEPFQNYAAVTRSLVLLTDPEGLGLAPRRITVSTVGLARRIRQFADDVASGTVPAAGLAVSLHAPTDPQRSAIMPVNRSEKTDLGALKAAIQHYAQQTEQHLTYEYCVFAGLNDTPEDARQLARVTRWAPSKVNLIVYNPVPGARFTSPGESELDRFIRDLVGHGVRVTVRRSRGQDIDAACGQLATLESER